MSATSWLARLLAIPLLASSVANAQDDIKNQNGRPQPARPAVPSPDLPAAERSIIDATNNFRAENKLAALKADQQLNAAARYFADFMAKEHKYSHTADGKQPAERAKEHGYDYCLVLENIAYQYNSRGFAADELSRAFFTGWKESPGHRANMLNPEVVETGVAVARGKSGYYFAVQMFGRPESMQIKFQIANESPKTAVYTLAGREFELLPRYTMTHELCSSPELRLRWGDDVKQDGQPENPAAPTAGADQQGLAVQPRSGSKYIVRQGAQGELVVAQE